MFRENIVAYLASNCGRYGKLEVRSCMNTGSMSNGTENGGIMGYNTGLDDSNSHVFVFNCYNTGGFSDSSGGICATSDSNGERVIILNEYSTCGMNIWIIHLIHLVEL